MIKAVKHSVLLLCVLACLLTAAGCGKDTSRRRPHQDVSSSEEGAVSAVTPGPRYDDVMPEGSRWEEIDRADYARLPDSITVACRETGGHGYVLDVTVDGYNADMVIRCGVDENGAITGAVCVSSNETLGAEKEYGDRFGGKTIATYDEVDTISGATYTTMAYKNAIKDALYAAVILGGADVDTRTPEEILADNLAAALPAGKGKFTEVFITEEINGVDALYAADNGAGYVCIAVKEAIGNNFTGEFVGIDANLNIVTAGSTANTKAAFNAVKAMNASTLSDINFANKGLNESITSVKKTATGNYVIDIEGRGYAYFDDNHGYGVQRFVPIHIRVSLTPDGKIIDCLTVSHEESENFGDKCGTEAYYSQFDG
ncbi:MAG: FMN-binding protein, partial [Clostridia bacterium]|nr:FMN-binding protein [Clostridia bacterium]